MIYAQIDENNTCFAISDMGSMTLKKDTLIPVGSFDEDVLGKRYNNGVWEDVPQPEPEPEPLTEQGQAILDIAVNAEYLVCLADLGL